MRPWECFLLAISALPFATFAENGTALPVVDLGYERYRAASFNQSGGFYNFSNIRYGAPATGDLRFRAPQSPAINRSTIHDGSNGRICPQAYPKWLALESAFIPSYLAGIPFNGSLDLSDYQYTPTPVDPRTDEDCLFLDILVPKQVYDSARMQKKYRGAPVLVWIYGGGYAFGDKTTQTGAPGLIERSRQDGSEGVIYLSFNYRLGAFGWLAGPTFSKSGTPNAGLLDQQLALKWVQKYINLFGGDPDRVTVFGESAGGGSILHHITAYGGMEEPAPFQQALLQSPGFLPLPQKSRQEQVFNQFLSLLNVSTIDEARKLPSETLTQTNAYHIGEFSYYGDFNYGPAVDGTFVPALPGQLLQRGDFHKNIKVMVGSNSDEGLLFILPTAFNESGYQQYLQDNLPGLTEDTRQYISETLYPPIFNGNFGYTNGLERGALTLSDLAFQCNTFYVNRAFGDKTYAYRFSIPPGVHAEDLPYTFYNGPNPAVANATAALILQDYITTFTKTGVPTSSLGPPFEEYGRDKTVLNFGSELIMTTLDPAASERCRWWQQAVYAH
ncbi:Alpha/Beta hydrolase protein [Talaromyces proteolyticus]|uniref:Carboxylic ester hydrolase n=1 Tax=Talaromyces proteolyticus TaxID=1131652 RepID=A0AAD4KMN1_9EURO|nr:Alpha/Beta hydrolase protein [Talaromyces proteolyticus]KAH8696178.1 Alpha/Beta hydrolase protein [Talaromyces proteolyticus]